MEQAAEAHQAAAAAKAEAPPGEAGKQDSLWRHRDFMLLWGGQTVSEMGSSVTQLALPLTAVVLLQASTFEVALLTSAATAAWCASAACSAACSMAAPGDCGSCPGSSSGSCPGSGTAYTLVGGTPAMSIYIPSLSASWRALTWA